ncbi:hypothetical protein SAZ11_00620 [Streptomyces sp. FXJ1.4098]|nr:hypothetical protein [Streptomyces sp. FXJ1.4098]
MQEINFSPKERYWVLVLIGEKPIGARENLAWDSQDQYPDLADKLTAALDNLRDSLGDVARAFPKQVGDAINKAMGPLLDSSGSDGIGDLLNRLRMDLPNERGNQSIKIQQAKWEIIAEITMMLIELAALSAMSFFTGGLSLSTAALVRARAALGILMAMQRLLNFFPIAGALLEAVQEMIQALAVNLAQLAINPRHAGRRASTGATSGTASSAAS